MNAMFNDIFLQFYSETKLLFEEIVCLVYTYQVKVCGYGICQTSKVSTYVHNVVSVFK